MNRNSKLWVIIKEVYRKNVKSGSFITMVLMPIVIMGIIFVIGNVMEKETGGTDSGNVAVVGADEEVLASLKNFSPSMTFTVPSDENAGLNELKDKNVDGILKIERAKDRILPSFIKTPSSKNINMTGIENALNEAELKLIAREKGISPEDASLIKNSSVNMKTMRATVSEDGKITVRDENDPESFVKRFLAYFVTVVVFMFIMNYVSIISQEIAAEKGSRIMEIILSSVKASTHFAGKMLGIGLVILTQLFIYLVLFIVGRQIVLRTGIIKNILPEGMTLSGLFSSAGNMVGLSIIYAVIGVLIYTSLAGFVGSLVSRTEDVPKMILPVTMTALVGFYIGMFAFASPNNMLVRVSSQIPLFTPFVMPFRTAAGLVSDFEIILSIVISLIFMVACLWISSVFYKSNVLTYSDSGLAETFKKSLTLWRSEKKVQ